MRAVLLAAALVAMATLAPQTSEAAGTLTNVSWAVSNNQVAATGVQYTWELTTATVGVVAKVTMTVPSGTAGTSLTVVNNFGIGAGTVSLSGITVTYTVTSPASVSAGTPIYLAFSGFTNTSASGSYTSTISTVDSTGLITFDSGTSPSVSFSANNTAVTVVVDQSTSVTNDTTALQLDMDPSVSSLADQSKTVTLTVKSNARSGYSVSVKDTGLTATGGASIPAVSTGVSTATSTFPNDRFGYAITATAGGSSGIADQGSLSSTSYAGYKTAGEVAVSATGPTGSTADTIAIANRVKISFATTADTYTDTVTYTVTPTY